MNYDLALVFESSTGDQYGMTINDVRSNVSQTEVDTLMTAIIESEAFDFASPMTAELRQTTITDLLA